MRLLYTFFIHLYYLSIRCAAVFNPKANLWVKGRRDVFKRLAASTAGPGHSVWFHCASLGEFEQGRPVLEAMKKQLPEYKIILTFFSPSGYEVRKNYSGADIICYLPLDTPDNAKLFMDIVKPRAVFFVKYEFWFNYMQAIHKKNIPLFLIAGIFRQEQHFFQWYGSWFRKQLGLFTYFFVQNEPSKLLLQQIGLNQVRVTGDTRFDRVFEIANQRRELPLIAQFKNANKLVVAGSTWEKDEVMIRQLIRASAANNNIKFIIAPHEISATRINELLKEIKTLISGNTDQVFLYSELNEKNVTAARVLIVDSIGILASLYYYSDVAYIGGGFGKGIHNILEAVAYGTPVIFGPNYHKFQEAVELIRAKGAFTIGSFTSLSEKMNILLSDETVLKNTSEINKRYVLEKRGATEKIMAHARSFLS